MKEKSETNIISTYSWKGFIFSVLSAGYFLLISPLIEKMSLGKFAGENPSFPIFGIILLTLTILEVYAFPRKMEVVKRLLKGTGEKIGGITMLLWITHIWISYGAMTYILFSFGYDFSGDKEEDAPFWFTLLLIAVFIKEIYLLLYMVVDKDISEADYKKYKKYNFLYDVILLLYSWIAFTVIWTKISSVSKIDIHTDNVFLLIFNIFALSILFLVMYLPIRITSLIEDWTLIVTGRDFFLFIFSILLVMISVISKM